MKGNIPARPFRKKNFLIASLVVWSVQSFVFNAEPRAQTINTFAGIGTPAGYAGDGGAATAAKLNFPNGVALDAAENVYIADRSNNRIRKVDVSTGIISTIAGTGTPGFSGDGGLATAAQLNTPTAISFDAAGNMYIADMSNYRVRKIDNSTGIISTIAGTAAPGFSGDGGLATAAQLKGPVEVAVDATGNVYIADKPNHRIRKVDIGTGFINTIAGTGVNSYNGDGIVATTAQLNQPAGLYLDAAGNVYIADSFNHRIRKVDAVTGIISTVAGNGTQGYSGDGGLPTAAQLNYPNSGVFDVSGNMYIADCVNNCVRKVDVGTGLISTIAGIGTAGFSGDGGAATAAQFKSTVGIAVDAAGCVYVADYQNQRIRKFCQVALPVELLSFTAKPIENKYVLLEWTTTAEVNNDYFIIERSQDLQKWENVEKVIGAGNSFVQNKYSLPDNQPYPGTSYYRLKQVDFNGDNQYYGPLSVRLDGLDIIIIYPIPAPDYISYSVVSSTETNVTLTVLDVLGRNVMKRSEAIHTGKNDLSLSFDGMSQGYYMLRLEEINGNSRTQKQFVVR